MVDARPDQPRRYGDGGAATSAALNAPSGLRFDSPIWLFALLLILGPIIRGFDGDVTPQRNGFVGNRYVDSGNVQRVEVVKGPASLLYGQITPGGTVR